MATVANRSSVVDVEQILGRVLRLPYAKATKQHQVLNLSYVITSSVDFYGTLDQVVAGLNNAGFSKKDYRVKDMGEDSASESEQAVQIDMDDYITYSRRAEKTSEGLSSEEDDPIINTENMKERLEMMMNSESTDNEANMDTQVRNAVDVMINTAERENTVYWENMDNERAGAFGCP